jgi:hypothetical protein
VALSPWPHLYLAVVLSNERAILLLAKSRVLQARLEGLLREMDVDRHAYNAEEQDRQMREIRQQLDALQVEIEDELVKE